MYVCVCKSISDKQVKEAIEKGASTVEDLACSLGVSTQCGRCHNFANTFLQSSTQNLENTIKAA
ncbi:MAG: bacterioferritin [Calditrichaeota bacterium]|nr:MAG: bacterioferritin [Calditrichota bacterium]